VNDFEGLLKMLNDSRVDFILVGGMAGIVHGAARVTYDLDIVYERSGENLSRLASALRPLGPRLRGAPADVPFLWDELTLKQGLNFTLSTSLGDIDVLGEIAGGGDFHKLIAHTIDVDIGGAPCKCLDLETLIAVKKAAGRRKDLDAVKELEALKQERDAAAGQ
jgi:predicted nucleotidyltransferase